MHHAPCGGVVADRSRIVDQDQEQDMTVVAACRDGQETVERLAQARPDVVVVTDLVMPRLGGSPPPHLSATTTPN